MTSVSPTVTTAAGSLSPTRRIWLGVLFCLVIAWIAALAWLVLNTANPPIVNFEQIRRSDAVFVGRWSHTDRQRFEATADLLHQLSPGAVTITGLPAPGTLDQSELVIPVRRSGENFVVTQGRFAYFPMGPDGKAAPLPMEGEISPQYLPATPDVLQQIDQLQRR